jgi:NNP family nitrate/nitrite transporter-like MFS transporter
MPQSVNGFSTGHKLLICAVVSLIGALVQIPYAMAANWFRGPNRTTFSSLVLLIATGWAIVLLARPGLRLWPYLVCGVSGLCGGNYLARLAKVDGLYPHSLKGYTLGLTGGMADPGFAAIQIIGPVVYRLIPAAVVAGSQMRCPTNDRKKPDKW